MSLELSHSKRRWLKSILRVGPTGNKWIASALLTPVIMGASFAQPALAQAPQGTRTISDAGQLAPTVDLANAWLDAAVKSCDAGDTKAACDAFAATLRIRHLIGEQKPELEKRLREVQTKLLDAKVTKEMVQTAFKSLPQQISAPATKVTADNPLDRRDRVAALTQAASAAIARGDRASAERMLAEADQYKVPAEWMLDGQLSVAQVRGQLTGAPVSPAVVNQPAIPGPVAQGVFNPGQDQSVTQPASAQAGTVPAPTGESPQALYQQGLELLTAGNREGAYDLFLRAYRQGGDVDPTLRAQLKDKLSSMQSPVASGGPEAIPAAPLRPIDNEQNRLAQQMMSEITSEIAAAEANQKSQPQVVADRLQTLRTRVGQSALDNGVKKRMLTYVDRAITAHQIYMTNNRAEIDQNLANQQVLEQRALSAEERYKLDQQVASLVETYNDLMDKKDFMEAETVAKQVGAIDPDSTISKLLIANSRNARRIGEYEAIKAMKEDKFVDNMLSVDRAAVPFDDREPLLFGDAKAWAELSKRRLDTVRESERGMSPAEARIWSALKQPVFVDFKNRPLAEVCRTLEDLSGVPIHIDEQGLMEEGLNPETPVTLSLPSQISLRSALNLLLNSRNLSFRVANEVLQVTSPNKLSEASVERVYSVKDLVIPIPNFVTDNNSGLAGALRHAYDTIGRSLSVNHAGGVSAAGGAGAVQLASASMNPNAPVLGQINPGVNAPNGFNGLAGGNVPNLIGRGFGFGGSNGPVMGSMPQGGPMSMGSPAPIGGGAAMADFDTLMNLIQQTIDPDDWLANGGTNTITPYPANLSIVVSAPQTTQERIAELLESLRRLQDLQVTIEVKFITLNDNFFERLGVDFDVRIDDNVRQLPLDDQGPSTTVGLSAGFVPGSPIPLTADFDVALTQNSFADAVPAFGNFSADSGASLGFAILSDLEMFFFMNAAQGDQRTNVLQAPRVTMFDGQFASINDTISRPFVTSLIPVVGDFAVAQQPVIVVLNEGTVLNVQATVSPDKRFVRLTLNPTFSQIDRVDTFTFQGTQTSDSGTNVLDPAGNPLNVFDNQTSTIAATTIQQPSFATTSVSTTVSVPDGGTILLGGIKRMREGRLERGVPILSKIPYVNRLFKNTAIGRETSTLMLTVTPRIIIQEEEEEKYGVTP